MRERYTGELEQALQAIKVRGFGLRKLVAFSKALLAKQGWCILKSPDSLMARVLKAKYFHSSSFLDAKLGSNPSYS